jgi:hypothetical protein
MTNDVNTLRLRALDPETFSIEGVIERQPVDAKEILATGRYEVVVASKAVPSVKEDVLKDDPMQDNFTNIDSMNSKALEDFIKNENLDVDLKGLKLIEKRQAVKNALEDDDL